MLVIDIVVAVIIGLAAVFGAVLGAGRALPAFGFAVGAVIGSRLPLLVGEELDSDFALALAIPAALLVGAAFGAFAERLAPRVSRVTGRSSIADGAAGAVLCAAAGVVLVWTLAPAVSEVNAARDQIQRSELLDRFNATLQPAGAIRTKEPPPIDDFPRFAGRTPNVAAGDPRVLTDPDVVAADRSVVKIFTDKCDGHGVGSGWVGKDGIVVTNAHVVAGTRAISVKRQGKGARHRAIPIWFDGEHDLALLRVDGLRGVRPLAMVSLPRAGTAGALVGFPLGRHAIRRARVGPTTRSLIGELGGRPAPGVSDKITGRLVTTVRARAQPGNSGGPVVDARGQVLTTVFGGGRGSSTLGVPNDFVRTALRKAGPRVDDADCKD